MSRDALITRITKPIELTQKRVVPLVVPSHFSSYFPERMVRYMDKLVGDLIDVVDEVGLSEDTLIIFTADNGTVVLSTPGDLMHDEPPAPAAWVYSAISPGARARRYS